MCKIQLCTEVFSSHKIHFFTSYATDEYPTRYYNVCCIAGYGDVSWEGKIFFDILSKLAADDNAAVRQLIAYGIYEVLVSVCVCVCDVCAGLSITRSNRFGLMFIHTCKQLFQ